MARAMSAAICPWLARNELASAAVTFYHDGDRCPLARGLLLPHDALGRDHQLATSGDDWHLVRTQARPANHATGVEARRVVEDGGIWRHRRYRRDPP
jgi:hypothetical protein